MIIVHIQWKPYFEFFFFYRFYFFERDVREREHACLHERGRGKEHRTREKQTPQ